MRVYDITVPLSSRTPIYPGDPRFEVQPWKSLENGDAANVSKLLFGAHTGTHVDAPAHFIKAGARLDSLSLEPFIGPARVVALPNEATSISEEFVRSNVDRGTERLLFKTRNSGFWRSESRNFRRDFTYLELDAAKALVEIGVLLVGIDYLSIEQFSAIDHATHLILLSNGLVILEGLDLSEIISGRYELICLPLKIADGHGDGAPARAVLRELI
jgi:arylformamidase